MSGFQPARWLAVQYDDYIEEVAVGTPWWVLPLVFGLGIPILAGAAAFVFGLRYPAGTYVALALIGLSFGALLRLLAHEREKYRARILGDVVDGSALRRKSWEEFEIIVGELLRSQGWLVRERGGFRKDNGVDLIAERKGTKAIIQCKHWQTWPVGEGEIKKLYADMNRPGIGGDFPVWFSRDS